MIDIQDARINTAGAYVCLDGSVLFTIGIQPYHGRIPVVRLGGHRQEHETGWECARREVYEEASLQVRALAPPVTYLADGDHLEAELEEIPWQGRVAQEQVPLLAVAYRREGQVLLSLMYLAQADGLPRPSSEVKGLLLLGKDDVHRLCRQQVTLAQYLGNGGRAILNAEFDRGLILEPLAQLRLLDRILAVESEYLTIFPRNPTPGSTRRTKHGEQYRESH